MSDLSRSYMHLDSKPVFDIALLYVGLNEKNIIVIVRSQEPIRKSS